MGGKATGRHVSFLSGQASCLLGVKLSSPGSRASRGRNGRPSTQPHLFGTDLFGENSGLPAAKVRVKDVDSGGRHQCVNRGCNEWGQGWHAARIVVDIYEMIYLCQDLTCKVLHSLKSLHGVSEPPYICVRTRGSRTLYGEQLGPDPKQPGSGPCFAQRDVPSWFAKMNPPRGVLDKALVISGDGKGGHGINSVGDSNIGKPGTLSPDRLPQCQSHVVVQGALGTVGDWMGFPAFTYEMSLSLLPIVVTTQSVPHIVKCSPLPY